MQKEQFNNVLLYIIADPIFEEDHSQNLYEEIINTDKNKQINIGHSALSYLKSKLKNHVNFINMNNLYRKIWIFWAHYNDFYINCHDKKLALLEINFSKPEVAAQKIDIFMNHIISIQKLLNILKQLMMRTKCFTLKFTNDQYLIVIDKKCKKNDIEIMRQFTYFVQTVTGDFAIQNKSLIKNMCKQFDLNDQTIKYIFNQKQFWQNIYNNLFNNLQKIYIKYDKEFTWEDFIMTYFRIPTNKINQFKDSFIYKDYDEMKLSHPWYLNVLAAIAYADKKFFNQIIEKLKNK